MIQFSDVFPVALELSFIRLLSGLVMTEVLTNIACDSCSQKYCIWTRLSWQIELYMTSVTVHIFVMGLRSAMSGFDVCLGVIVLLDPNCAQVSADGLRLF